MQSVDSIISLYWILSFCCIFCEEVAMMENAEEIFHFLEDFSKRKPKTIPQELNDYLAYVARTGDPVYQWSLVKSLFKEKLLNVITDFYETTPGIDIPPYPNVDPFNYDIMKNSLLERLDSFNSAPFTVQRICELLTYPRKQYNRVDKFMRAVEKNILVVSTREPGHQRHPENGEPIVNGSDNNSDYNVDVEMEDMSWKDNSDSRPNPEPQPGSSETHINVDDIETRLHIKKDTNISAPENASIQFESSTPPDLNANEPSLDNASKTKPLDDAVASTSDDLENNNSTPEPPPDNKIDEEMKSEATTNPTMIIPEIKVDDAEMTEQKLIESKASEIPQEEIPKESTETTSNTQASIDDSSSDSNSKEEECKLNIEVSSSSEESSSSSDNTDGNSNSPKTEEHADVREECPPQAAPEKTIPVQENLVTIGPIVDEPVHTPETEKETVPPSLESENYSISDVKSELPQDTAEVKEKEDKVDVKPETEEVIVEENKKEEPLPDSISKDSTNVESTEA